MELSFSVRDSNNNSRNQTNNEQQRLLGTVVHRTVDPSGSRAHGWACSAARHPSKWNVTRIGSGRAAFTGPLILRWASTARMSPDHMWIKKDVAAAVGHTGVVDPMLRLRTEASSKNPCIRVVAPLWLTRMGGQSGASEYQFESQILEDLLVADNFRVKLIKCQPEKSHQNNHFFLPFLFEFVW